MKKFFVLLSLLFLLSNCARKKPIETTNFDIVMEVEEAYIQREIPGVAELKPLVKIYLIVQHDEQVQLDKVKVFGEELPLQKSKNVYSATFQIDPLLTFKGMSVSGLLVYRVADKQRELPIVFQIREDVYMP